MHWNPGVVGGKPNTYKFYPRFSHNPTGLSSSINFSSKDSEWTLFLLDWFTLKLIDKVVSLLSD